MGAAIKLPIPPSTNKLWMICRRWDKGRKVTFIGRTREFESWLQHAALLCRVAIPTVRRYPVEIEVSIVGGRGFDGHRRDLDNCLKAVQDAVKHSGRIEDDTCRHIAAVRMDFAVGHGDAECWVAIHEPAAKEGAARGEALTEDAR